MLVERRVKSVANDLTPLLSAGADTSVLVSCFGSDGRGGIVDIASGRAEVIDSIPTTGLGASADQLARVLYAPGESTSCAELVISDRRGIVAYHRLDQLNDPHDVARRDDAWLVVSSGTNEIVEVRAGEVHSIWAGPEAPDALHVNCLCVTPDDVWATAFGRFETHKGWRGDRADGTGVLFGLRTPVEIGGLSHPHSPRAVDGGWLLCESIRRAVTRLDRAGCVVARQLLDGYTRGLAVTDDAILVGLSRGRAHEDDRDAVIAVLDRATLTPRRVVPVPAAEIYDIVVVPRALSEGVRNGFNANVLRVAQRGPGLPFAGAATTALHEIGRALDADASACRIRCSLARVATAGRETLVDVEIENTGANVLASVEPEPVNVASRWITADGSQHDGDRIALPVMLAPGQRTTIRLPVCAPAPGVYELRVSLVHEGRFWFDDLDGANGARQTVVVSDPLRPRRSLAART
jgi:hypothetical protein